MQLSNLSLFERVCRCDAAQEYYGADRMQSSPIFTYRDGTWIPDPVARGPFEGIHGGAVASLMCAAVEKEAEPTGFVASASTHFLRPVPLEPLTLEVHWLRQGRRVGTADVTLSNSSRELAVQRVTVIQKVEQPELQVPSSHTADPESGSLEQSDAPHGQAWLMDVMERRTVADGTVWFKMRRPIVELQGPLSSIIPVADWAHGIGAIRGVVVRPPGAIPNADLSVHLLRPPKGNWIGLHAESAWSTWSTGVGCGAIYDVEGLIGRVVMAVVVVPVQEGT